MDVIQFINATANATPGTQAFVYALNGVLSLFFVYILPFFVVFVGAVAVIKTATED